MRPIIFFVAALAALGGAMTVGRTGVLIWAAAVLSAFILVRKSWPKTDRSG